jgi:tRNA pseudouridine-54 N-methylase
MLRTLVAALAAALVLGVGLARADEVKATLKSVDADKNTVTVTVDGKDTTYTVSDATQFLNAKGKNLKKGIKNKQLKEGANVVITTEKKDDKDVVTKVAIEKKQ